MARPKFIRPMASTRMSSCEPRLHGGNCMFFSPFRRSRHPINEPFINTCAKSCGSFTVSIVVCLSSGNVVLYKMLPNPWLYSSIVCMFLSVFGSGRLLNNGATCVNLNSGMAIGFINEGIAGNFFPPVYLARVFLSS